MSNVVEFPPGVGVADLLVGPFEYHQVIVEGRAIPRLTGYPQDDGRITLIVDSRFMADFEPDAARRAAWLIGQALAIGEGYSHLGAPTKTRPFAPKSTQLGEAPE